MSGVESQQDKDQAIVKMSGQFVHDITTPLITIQMLAKALETYLPAILSAHQQLKDKGQEVIDIPKEQYSFLENSAASIQALSRQVNNAARDYWQKIDQQFGHVDETDSSQLSKSAHSISLEQKLRILVAEDDAIHQKIAVKLLSDRHRIDIAVNGRDAVECCRRQTYDLILMDLHMPIMDGPQAVIEIMNLTNSSPVIIGLTNRPLGSEKKQLLLQGFNGFIEKPLNVDELTGLMAELGLPEL